MEDLIKLLINSNLKLVEKETGIPYDRMYKWVKGKATPKTNDYTTLLNYFNKLNVQHGKTSNTSTILHGNRNVTNKIKPIGSIESEANLSGLSDSRPVNHQLGYDENSTFPNGRIEEPQTIPMYNVPASASMLEMYADVNDVKVVGHLSIPGAVKGSFALPVHGHSMYPTLANGSWGIVRPIMDRQDIEWGNIYYIEYGDYRVWKRLIKDDNPDNVILYSDNDKEMVGGRSKYAAKIIKAERISRLCLLTDILIKPNY